MTGPNVIESLDIILPIDEGWKDVLGIERIQIIADNLQHIVHSNLILSRELAIAGAMRWPLSFRPGAIIKTSVEIC